MTPADTMRAAVEALIVRLRTPRVTHHQVSKDWEDYATVARTHPVEAIKLEAADMLDSLLRSALEGGEPTLSDEQIDALDKKFALGVMAPRGKDSVREFARALLASIPPNTPVEAGKLGVAAGVQACPRCKQPAANLFRTTLPGDELDTTHCGCLYTPGVAACESTLAPKGQCEFGPYGWRGVVVCKHCKQAPPDGVMGTQGEQR